MKRTGAVTKVLAIAGTVLLWVPLVAPVVFTRWAALGSGHFNFDWLIPAELFPAVILGGGLLLWAALRAHARRALVAWGWGVAVGALVLSQVFAMVTGLASGAAEPTGLPMALVIGGIAIYVAATIELAISGILVISDLFRHHSEESTPPVIPAM